VPLVVVVVVVVVSISRTVKYEKVICHIAGQINHLKLSKARRQQIRLKTYLGE
jgi:hypothetical protein